MTLKTENALFLSARHYFYLQDIKISFEFVDFYAKMSLILYTPSRNSTTQQTIISTLQTVFYNIKATLRHADAQAVFPEHPDSIWVGVCCCLGNEGGVWIGGGVGVWGLL